jgi:hypothetical protein
LRNTKLYIFYTLKETTSDTGDELVLKKRYEMFEAALGCVPDDLEFGSQENKRNGLLHESVDH